MSQTKQLGYRVDRRLADVFESWCREEGRSPGVCAAAAMVWWHGLSNEQKLAAIAQMRGLLAKLDADRSSSAA